MVSSAATRVVAAEVVESGVVSVRVMGLALDGDAAEGSLSKDAAAGFTLRCWRGGVEGISDTGRGEGELSMDWAAGMAAGGAMAP